uniref:Uncharacterized protein n=1 Tax=Arundo donax TaxID=35708 RepID=A0A0A9HCG7_ARUDO
MQLLPAALRAFHTLQGALRSHQIAWPSQLSSDAYLPLPSPPPPSRPLSLSA